MTLGTTVIIFIYIGPTHGQLQNWQKNIDLYSEKLETRMDLYLVFKNMVKPVRIYICS